MSKLLTLCVAALVLLSAAVVPAAEKDSAIVVTVAEMCGGCVKKITARLTEMPEVANVACDLAAKSVTVTPKAGGISARALWEAMDEIGKTHVKLVDATGTYTEKPQN